MGQISRRKFTTLTAAAISTVSGPNVARAARQKVVVIGGGAGGATAARLLSSAKAPGLDVTLVEPSRTYTSCFYSNHYLGGIRDYDFISHDYRRVAAEGVRVIHDWADQINRETKSVVLGSGDQVFYDRLILSPGIDIDYASVAGYSPAATAAMPHAWKSGTQVAMLKAQIEAMPEGGTFAMVAPP
ncbi:MAG: FAD/NAD(P)-binding oxidoreductase, partial [Pseudomonadota bacterium]